MKPSMKRKKDGLILPYSEELVATHPGKFIALRFDPKTRKFIDGAPLLPKAKPVPLDDDGVVFVDAGRETPPAAPRVDPEPDTSDEEEDEEAGEESQPPESSKPAEPETRTAAQEAEPSATERGEPDPETPAQDPDASVETPAKRKKGKK